MLIVDSWRVVGFYLPKSLILSFNPSENLNYYHNRTANAAANTVAGNATEYEEKNVSSDWTLVSFRKSKAEEGQN